jgi:hypothetical protein
MQDELFKNQNGDLVCLIYSIAEVDMFWYSGRLAVFKNKLKPKAILNPKNLLCNASGDMLHFSCDNKR